MTGFVVPRTTFKLVFTDPEHAGMVVRVRAMSVREAMRAVELRYRQPSDSDTVETIRAGMDELHASFVQHIADWNLTEEDDTPVPLTVEGLRSLEGRFVGTLVGTWLDTVTGVSPPLPSPSNDGDSTLTLAEIPCESLAS